MISIFLFIVAFEMYCEQSTLGYPALSELAKVGLVSLHLAMCLIKVSGGRRIPVFLDRQTLAPLKSGLCL